jgi:O-antigen/teichoic acid export membrane protein
LATTTLTSSPSSGLASVALRNAFAGWLTRVLIMITGLILTPFILGRLGKDLYGLVAMTSSIFGYLWMLRGGLGGAMRRYVTFSHHSGQTELAQEHYAVGFWLAAILRFVVLGCGLLLAEPICRFVRLPDIVHADGARGVMLVVLSAVITDVGSILEVPVYVTGKIYRISLARGAAQLIRMGMIFLGLGLIASSLTVYGGALVVSEILALVIMATMASRSRVVPAIIPPVRFGNSSVRSSLFRFGGLSVLSQVASILYLSTDNLLIGRFYGAGAVTHYNLGTRWAPMISGFLLAAVDAITPLLTQLEAKAEAARSQNAIVRSIALTSAFAVPFCLVPCVVGDLFLVRWVGEEFRSSYPLMIAMLAPLVLEISVAPIWTVLVARGKIGWIATADIVLALANVTLSLVLALGFGMGLLGFALGNTTALLAKNLLLRPIVLRREPGLPPLSRAFVSLGRALVGAAPGLLLLWLARRWIGGSLATVLVAGLVAGLVSLAGSLWMAVGVQDTRALVQMIKRLPRFR